MGASDALALLTCHRLSGLAKERVHEQSAAHPDATVDAPDGELDAFALERFTPCEHVLVDAVDERAVEIEQERRRCELHGLAHVLVDLRLLADGCGHVSSPMRGS